MTIDPRREGGDVHVPLLEAWHDQAESCRAYTSVGQVRLSLDALVEARADDGLWGAGPGASTGLYYTSLVVAALAKSQDPAYHDIVADVSLRYRDQYRSNSRFDRLNSRDLSSLIRTLASDSASDSVLIRRVAEKFAERILSKIGTSNDAVSCALLARALLTLSEYTLIDPPRELIGALASLQREDGSWGEGSSPAERISPTSLGYVALAHVKTENASLDRMRESAGHFLVEAVGALDWDTVISDTYSLTVIVRALSMIPGDEAVALARVGVEHLLALTLPDGGWSAGASGILSVEFTSLAVLALAEAGETTWVKAGAAEEYVASLAGEVDKLRSEVMANRARIEEAANRRCGELKSERDRLHLANISLQSELDALREEFADSADARAQNERRLTLEMARLRSRTERAEMSAVRDQRAIRQHSRTTRAISIAMQIGLVGVAAVLILVDVSSTLGAVGTSVVGALLVAVAVGTVVLLDRRLVVGQRMTEEASQPMGITFGERQFGPEVEVVRRDVIGAIGSLPSGLAIELLLRVRDDWNELPPTLFRRRAESLVLGLPLDPTDVRAVLGLLEAISRLDPVERVLLVDQLLPLIDETGWSGS